MGTKKKTGKHRTKQEIKSEAKRPVIKEMRASIDKLHALEKLKYDGVVGTLPKWMPEPLKREFEATREYLLDQFSHEEILKLTKARKESFKPGFRWLPSIPPAIEDKLDSLNYIQALAKLSEERGIKAYLGKGGAKVYRKICISERNKTAAKNPRPNTLTPLLAKIISANKKASTDEIIALLAREKGNGIIETVTKKLIEWSDHKGRIHPSKTIYIPDLKSRIIKLKKNILKK